MFEKFICIEAKNGNCKKDCHHVEPHDFNHKFCDDICSEHDKKVICVQIDMENYV